jgi:hypothetical protein
MMHLHVSFLTIYTFSLWLTKSLSLVDSNRAKHYNEFCNA